MKLLNYYRSLQRINEKACMIQAYVEKIDANLKDTKISMVQLQQAFDTILIVTDHCNKKNEFLKNELFLLNQQMTHLCKETEEE